jgi:capsule polysaccharide export protein KpsE/RkpR
MNAHLETYLNDHLAGSDSALDLLTRLDEKYANMTLDLAEVRSEVQEDQKELKTIMARLNSPYRFIINPIVDYVLDLEEKNHDS